MKPILATRTLHAISELMLRDQGASYRRALRDLLPKVEDAYRGDEDPYRSHLGASIIGRDCAREVWYSWHWVTKPQFDGRMLRLFNRGHLEEARFVALLQIIDCEVWQFDEHGSQTRFTGHGGHYGGGLDAVIRGVPDMPSVPLLGEFKTHNDKSFQKLKAQGVRTAKFEHYVQMNQYMGGLNLSNALYLAANKNDDELYGEIVPYDRENHERFMDRARQIIEAKTAPAKINESPGWFQCKFCDHREVCHGSKQPERNCRTCVHAIAGKKNGEWLCTNPNSFDFEHANMGLHVLTKEEQVHGCHAYEVNPAIKV